MDDFFYNTPLEERKRFISKVIKESNEDQRALVREYERRLSKAQ